MVTAVAFQDLVLDRAAARVDPPADAAAAAQHEAPALVAQLEPSSWSHLLLSAQHLGAPGAIGGCSRKGRGGERNKQAKEIGGR